MKATSSPRPFLPVESRGRDFARLPLSGPFLLRQRESGGDADDEGGLTGVAGVEDAAQLVVAPEERVGFVNEEGGMGFLDDAEEGGRADVGGDDGSIDQFAEDGEESGFAAALFG
jgi:hypothetical protein